MTQPVMLGAANPDGYALSPIPADHMQLDADPTLLQQEIMGIITQAILDHPRTLQKEIGPSGIGTPCTRKLVYLLGQVPQSNPGGVNWRATVGTAVHAWLGEVFTTNNMGRSYTRWLVEMGVQPGFILETPFTGHSDLYDRITGTVVDWKISGPNGMKNYQSHRGQMKAIYRVQGHVYGLGWTHRGLPVRHVMIVVLPAAGELRDAVIWTEPYDEQVALEALHRANSLAVTGAGPLGYGSLAQLAATADDYCPWCEWYAPANPDPAVGRCGGHR